MIIQVAIIWILLFCGFSTAEALKGHSVHGVTEVQAAFDKGDYEKTLQLLDPLLKAQPHSPKLNRLSMLSLVLTMKTKEGVTVYENVVKRTGREDEPLLRELAIKSILPFRVDMREQIRGAAYSALIEIDSNEMVSHLLDGLKDGNGMIRALVVEGLGKLKDGQKSTGFLEALNDRAGLVRVYVLKGLGRSQDPSFIPLVKKSLQDEQEVVQVAAAGALYKLGLKKYWDRVHQGTLVEEGYERGAALRMLGELGDRRALPILRKGLQDSQPSIRAAAAASLGQLALPEAIPDLIGLLSEPIPAVRSVAAVSLGKLKAEEAVPALTEKLNDPNPGVRTATIAALLQMNSPFSLVAGTVPSLIQTKNPGIRSALAKALANGRRHDVVGPLSVLLNDPVPRPRITAVRSLGRIEGRELLPLLKQGLTDSDAAVRVTAAAAIVKILDAPAHS
jgi:HEAT repeat protein